MLHEILNTKQNPGEPFRRWFQDPKGFNLVVWVDNNWAPIGFELSLNDTVVRFFNDAFEWYVSSEERVGTRPASEILTPAKRPPSEKIIGAIFKFEQDSKRIDPIVKAYVINKLRSLVKLEPPSRNG